MSVNLINTLPNSLKLASKFVAYQEGASGLSASRLIQDTGTCLLPKATFSRSKEDLAENTFLELSENTIVYLGPAVLGEKVARKVFSRGLNSSEKELIAKSVKELSAMSPDVKKKIVPIKAAIALSAMLIPLAEFSLSYLKNLFTLSVFKKSDFQNIASLEKNEEDKEQQTRVRKSAKDKVALAGMIYGGLLATSILLAQKGKNHKSLQELSELILNPGEKLFKQNSKKSNFVNKYFSQDFNSENGKLVLSKGQLTSCVTIGGLGYFGASADRGRENLLETASRFPLVGFYIITGGELFDRGFKKLLCKLNCCQDVIDKKDLSSLTFSELEKKSVELAKQRCSTPAKEFKKLAKQKVLVNGVPYVFGIGVMGFFVAGMTNYFTRRRHNKAKLNQNNQV